MYGVSVLALCVLAFACATGGQSGSGGDGGVDASTTRMDAGTTPKQDSNTSMVSDAPKMDALVSLPDSAVTQPDAPSGPFCMTNSQCTVAGECCVAINGVGFCAPGTVIAGVCFPQ